MSDYPKDEQGRKKALAANEKFHKPDDDIFSARIRVNEIKCEAESLIKQVDEIPPRAIDFLHNASWHLTQALKIIDEVK